MRGDLVEAYFVLGIGEFLSNATRLSNVDWWEGELGFVLACLELVEGLDVADPEEGYNGVFVYEVAQPFGKWVAERLNEGGPGSVTAEAADAKVAELIKAMG